MNGGLFFDELFVSQRFNSPAARVTAEQIKRFAAEFDPQPFHLDEQAASASLLGGLAASGWHTASITMRLLVEGGLPFAGGLLGAGAQIDWLRPTRPGDELHVVSEIVELKASRTKPDRGIVVVRSETLNHHHETVLVLTSKVMVLRKTQN